MSTYKSFGPSRPVVVVPYQGAWAEEFAALAQRMRTLLGPSAVRIDHIGSTAVPGLSAKDVIDVQLTAPDWATATHCVEVLRAAGFREGLEWQYDVFHALPSESAELRKRYLREPAGERRTHIHLREAGRFNARYALLFRDYLRANHRARAEYELLKSRAAGLFPNSIDGYLYLKEPVFHLIYEAATLWAAQVGWELPPADA